MSRAAVEALVWETERARQELVAYARSLPPHVLEWQVEGKQGSVKGILAHVASAGYYFIKAALEANRLPVPAAAYPEIGKSRELGEIFAALDDVRDFTFRGTRALEDGHLSTRLATRWGEEYSCGQLLEHALVHFLRHRRQLERIVLGAIRAWDVGEA